VLQKYSIKEIEVLTGIKAHTIRIWEQRYNIVAPKRTQANFRFYDDTDVTHLINIAFLNKNGYKISQIAEMPNHQRQHLVATIGRQEINDNALIDALIQATRTLNEDSFERSFAAAIAHIGVEDAMIGIVFPFMRQLGYLWQAGTITAAHEHFASNIIRQKLIMETQAAAVQPTPTAQRYLLYLPEKEYHELGLLFANYILKVRGHHTMYLGQNVPFDNITQVNQNFDPKYIITAISAALENQNLETYLQKLSQTFINQTIYISGYYAVGNAFELPANIKRIHSFDALIALADGTA
jgi:DNA-binding transcriptional MerR regulator